MTNKPKKTRENGTVAKDQANEFSNDLCGILYSPIVVHQSADEHGEMSKKHQLDQQLKLLLEEKKLSLRQLSKLTKVPISTLSGYMKANRAQIDPTHLIAIAKELSVTTDFLLTGKSRRGKIESMPTKKLFSRWVKLTIEDIDDEDGQ